MTKQTVKYTDLNGMERTETHYFDLSEAEIIEMELTTAGTFTEYMQKIITANDPTEMFPVFKKLILESYGVKSDDGRSFLKKDADGRKLCIGFEQTIAFSKILTGLVTDAKKSSNFFNELVSVIKDTVEAAEAAEV